MAKIKVPSTITKPEIAQESGVSLSTVKTYLNGGIVSEKSEKAIKEAMNKIIENQIEVLSSFKKKS